MITKKYECAKIEAHSSANGVFTMILYAPKIAKDALPGQFVMVYLDKGEHLLPRPISLYNVEKTKGEITLKYAIAGKGTKVISEWPVGHTLQVLGPLGNGFDLEGFKSGDRVALVGGGIGIPPLYLLAKELNKLGVWMDVYLGFRSAIPQLCKCFETLADNICIVTEDGQGKNKGYVTDFLPENPGYASILSCGPIPMLKSLAAYAKTKNIPCQVSVEERMACGLGACKGCVVKTMIGYQLCCLNGPVFDSKEVNWDG